ncbi:ExeM/NucH family extracellular endonuclease [Photobacterium damselae]|uniref:ExeM/NucH family extracellular endonuclease n=1 Tax=Photobacterium damselae TaxID=38293 RepID=UPI0025432DDB
MKKSLLAIIIGSAVSAVSFAASADISSQTRLKSTIQEIQGIGFYSLLDGISVENKQYQSIHYHSVDGIITAIQEKKLGNDLPVGFFIQAPSDNNPNTSDAIFVQTANIQDLKKGNHVNVIAKIKENYGWTILTDATVTKISEGDGSLPPVTELTIIDGQFDQSLERHEGMLVRIDQPSKMAVTKNFGFDYNSYRNNLLLTPNAANVHPNQNNAPMTSKLPKDDMLVVESFTKAPAGQIPWYPTFGEDNGTGTSDNYIRINDIVDGLEGVVGYSYGHYRLYVTNKANGKTFIHTNPRESAPMLKEGGDLRIASFNVLNYFNDGFNGINNNPKHSNRGATTSQEFDLQSEKIATAIATMNADIIGLMEIENNGFGPDSAVADLVQKINAKIPDENNHYVYVKPDNNDKNIGEDAITSQVIYRPSKVKLAQYRIIKMPEQHAPKVYYIDSRNKNKTESGQNFQRDTIAPTFNILNTNETLTLAVNHFKSKGSTCWEDVYTGKQIDLDHQGSCENLRIAAADHLGNELNKISGSKIIIGDLNSYANEDPVMVLTNRDNAAKDHVIKTAAYTKIKGESIPPYAQEGQVIDRSYGYTNIIRTLHPDSYSFSYQNNIGTLDYVLISPDLKDKVVDAKDWNINAGESTLFEYSNKHNCSNNNTECSKRYADIYRASDHDPAIVDLKIKANVSTSNHSGGSAGIFSLLGLIGISLLRKRIAKS